MSSRSKKSRKQRNEEYKANIAHLSEMFPDADRSVVVMMFSECAFDLDAAAAMIAESIADGAKAAATNDPDAKRGGLMIFPTYPGGINSPTATTPPGASPLTQTPLSAEIMEFPFAIPMPDTYPHGRELWREQVQILSFMFEAVEDGLVAEIFEEEAWDLDAAIEILNAISGVDVVEEEEEIDEDEALAAALAAEEKAAAPKAELTLIEQVQEFHAGASEEAIFEALEKHDFSVAATVQYLFDKEEPGQGQTDRVVAAKSSSFWSQRSGRNQPPPASVMAARAKQQRQAAGRAAPSSGTTPETPGTDFPSLAEAARAPTGKRAQRDNNFYAVQDTPVYPQALSGASSGSGSGSAQRKQPKGKWSTTDSDSGTGTLSLASALKLERLQARCDIVEMTVVEDVFRANGCLIGETVKALDRMYPGVAEHVTLHREPPPQPDNSANTAPPPRPRAVRRQIVVRHVPTANQTATEVTLGDERNSRALAAEHARLRNWCFQQASRAYSAGDGAAASRYAAQGREHDQLMREANSTAGEAAFFTNNSGGGSGSSNNSWHRVDLHGLTVVEAVDYLDWAIDQHAALNHSGGCAMEIITGAGKHSHRGRAKLKPAIRSHLQSCGYRVSEIQEGALKITLR